MSNGKPYIPVSCDMHSQFELLIMHNSSIKLDWQDENGQSFSQPVNPKDLQTKSGEEFLIVVKDNNEQLKIRLDRIQSFKEL